MKETLKPETINSSDWSTFVNLCGSGENVIKYRNAWDEVCKSLKSKNYDLSKIKIVKGVE